MDDLVAGVVRKQVLGFHHVVVLQAGVESKRIFACICNVVVVAPSLSVLPATVSAIHRIFLRKFSSFLLTYASITPS